MSATVAELRRLGVLTPLDEHFARTLGRIANERCDDVLLAAALLSRQVEHGHVCLDLRRFVGEPLAADGESELPTNPEWPGIDAWLGTLRASPLVGVENTPLVLDDGGRLYLRRYHEHQRRLAAAILSRAGEAEPEVDSKLLNTGLDRLFPDPAETPDYQRIAAEIAVRRRFCVISGGPGTGKTYTVVKILALLIEQAHGRNTDLRVALVAPTGKAAARLRESVQSVKQHLDCDEEIKARIPDEASTIHRYLGAIPGRLTKFRRDASNPVSADVVLVDEASMVDLALMARLTDALPPRARLILLGDKDQLASVEAGAVLGDICSESRESGVGGESVGSRELAEAPVSATPNSRLPSRDSRLLSECIVQLHHSYRYRTDSGIGALARAINAGDADAALAILARGEDDLRLVSPASDGSLDPALLRRTTEQFAATLRADGPAAALTALDCFRVLCAHRRGPFGVRDVNRRVEEALLGRRTARRAHATPYCGQPLLVTQNDYQTDLRNGDVGIVLADGEGILRAHFTGNEGKVRALALSRLPPHEPVFAMSIHKSQGSEFDEAAVLLPTQPSPILSRELLYTAVTRARKKVAIYASPEIVRATIARRIERTSGMRELLWGRS